MTYERINFEHYYDGHYTDSGKSKEEREQAEKLAREENEKLVSWPEVDH